MRELTASEQSAVNDLCWNWDEAYEIAFDGDVYVAHRLGYPEHILTGQTPMELRLEIRRDYGAWQASMIERSSL